MKYVTDLERFAAGDFPMVCARTGRPATRLLPVHALRSRFGLPLFFTGGWIGVAKFLEDPANPWGLLPFADGQTYRVAVATYRPGVGVILRGVHPAFVAAAADGAPPTER